MEQLHAHEVLHMREGNSYTEASLRAAIVEKFGEHQRFYTCSADNMEVDELIGFLNEKGSSCLPVRNLRSISVRYAVIDSLWRTV